jgi:hypothetical protein
MPEYAIHRFPCLDKYPEGKQFVSNKQTLEKAAKIASIKSSGDVMSDYKTLKAAFVVNSLWNPHTHPKINITFLDGSQKQQEWVEKVITENLQPLMNRIQFVWNAPRSESHMRISFALPNQAWSVIGSQALNIPKNEPTMNLGWLDDDVQFDAPQYKNTGQVVLHEFGHAIGMIHEHQNPTGNPIKWNKPVVYSELARTNKWDSDMVDHNMFTKYGDYDLCEKAKTMPMGVERRVEMSNYCVGELINGSSYDPTSIMHYLFPASWMIEGPPIPVNKTFSATDKQWISKFYSQDPITAIANPTPVIAPAPVEVVDVNINPKFPIRTILQILFIIVFISLIVGSVYKASKN